MLADDNYDFSYQQMRTLKNERTVLPGDYLRVTCVTNSTHKKVPTFVSIVEKVVFFICEKMT